MKNSLSFRMLHFRSLLFFLFLPTLLLISHGLSHNLHPQSTHIPGNEYGIVSRRVLEDSTSFVLAADRTRRKDPINNFRYYTGGWNISDKHYFTSAAYSAAPLFVIATIWFVGCGLSLLLFCICCCCCRRKTDGFSKTAYALSLALLSLFTISAIVGCIVLYVGQGKFFNTTSDTLQYVVYQANTTAQNLKGVSKSLEAAKGISVGQLSLPSDVKKGIDKVDSLIDSASYILEHDVYKNKKKIDKVLDKVSLALIIVAAVMLLLAFLGFLCSIFGLQSVVYILVMIGWVLVACTFILCGVFLVLHNVAGDTCVAIDEWVQNPTADTAIDQILPCVKEATAQQIMSETKKVTYLLVGIVNEIVANVSNKDTINFNQSGPLVPLLCNPLNPDMSTRICAPGEVNFTNAKEVWKDYICQVSKSVCTTVGRLTPGLYGQMNKVVDVSFGLHEYGPFIVSLLDCSFVRDTFKVIHEDDCPGLRRFSKWIYIGLLLASVALMLSLIFWVIYAREQKNRKYSKLAKITNGDSFVEQKAFT